MNDFLVTVQGICIQGSPSICIGNVFLVFIIISLHWAKRRPEALKPVRTWPICRQFSKPITSINRSPISNNGSDRKWVKLLASKIMENNLGHDKKEKCSDTRHQLFYSVRLEDRSYARSYGWYLCKFIFLRKNVK